MTELAGCPNVMVKLSGLGMRIGGFNFEDDARCSPTRWSSPRRGGRGSNLASRLSEPDRCMYGSNFPVDKGSYGFKTGVNAMKRLTSGASQDEKDDIFWRSAQAFYRLPDAALGMGAPGNDALKKSANRPTTEDGSQRAARKRRIAPDANDGDPRR